MHLLPPLCPPLTITATSNPTTSLSLTTCRVCGCPAFKCAPALVAHARGTPQLPRAEVGPHTTAVSDSAAPQDLLRRAGRQVSEDPLSPSGVRRILATVRSALRTVFEDDLIKRSPPARLRRRSLGPGRVGNPDRPRPSRARRGSSSARPTVARNAPKGGDSYGFGEAKTNARRSDGRPQRTPR